jgi:hypothetical protein
MPEVKRQTAYKCSVKMILDGKYVQRPGWEPNYRYPELTFLG